MHCKKVTHLFELILLNQSFQKERKFIQNQKIKQCLYVSHVTTLRITVFSNLVAEHRSYFSAHSIGTLNVLSSSSEQDFHNKSGTKNSSPKNTTFPASEAPGSYPVPRGHSSADKVPEPGRDPETPRSQTHKAHRDSCRIPRS